MPTHSFSALLSVDAESPVNTVSQNSSRFIRAIRKAQRRRGSMGEVRRPRPTSAPVVEPRLTKSSQHHRKYRSFHQLLDEQPNYRQQQHWDPHIDAFEVLRAKITGITRTMQEFHVNELFQDELSERRERHHTVAACGTTKDPSLIRRRHRRVRSQGSMISSSCQEDEEEDEEEEDDDEEEEEDSLIQSPLAEAAAPPLMETTKYGSDPWAHLHTDQDFERAIIEPPTSPNLTALFLTTNSLINSRLDELSETASVASSCDITSPTLEWRTQFLELMSSCITQSEELESLSTELLGTERRVRELLVLNETVEEQFHEREKAYEERIRECQDVAKQQLYMIDTLDELMADIDMKMELLLKKGNESTDGNSDAIDEDENSGWDFSQSIADILGIESKDDLVHQMRWQVGMFVGGGVGTGHVIHSFEGRFRGIEMMIAGSGTTVEEEEEEEDSNIEVSER